MPLKSLTISYILEVNTEMKIGATIMTNMMRPIIKSICFAIISTLLAHTSATQAATEATKDKRVLKGDIAASYYTRLNKNGKAISKTTEKASCVKDTKTGLVWELKTDDGFLHDKKNTYRWGGIGAEHIGSIFFDDWNVFIRETNKEKLCGFNDWRVPTIDELKSLIVLDGNSPAINRIYFPLTLEAPYWSSSGYENYPEHAQTVHFGTGVSYYYNGYRGDHLSLRLVRRDK